MMEMDFASNPLLMGVLIAAGLMAALILGQRLYTYALLRRLRLHRPESAPFPREQIPPAIRPILDTAAPALEVLGFEYLDSFRTLSAIRDGEPQPIYGDRYFNPGNGCVASVHPADLPEPGAVANSTFQTLLSDGRILATSNRRSHQYLPMPDGYLLEDGYLTSVAEQWALHQRRVADAGSEVVADPEQVRRREDVILRGLIDHWIHTGFTEPVDDETVRMTSSGARRYLRTMIEGNRRLAKLPRLEGAESTEVRIAADLRAYRANEARFGKGAFGRSGKSVLFATSALLGIVAFGTLFSWEFAAVLLSLLLFHEFGHALAMLATGHRNVQVLVLPLLGAVASGRKDDAGPWTRLFVLLAGPAPGLVLAVVLLYMTTAATPPAPLLLQFGLVALLINLFNLLPLTPLDGGQIVELFLFARWPRLRFMFFLLSLAGMVALGLWLDSHVLLALAIFLGFVLRGMWQRFQLAAQIGPVDSGRAPEAIITAIHQLPEPKQRGFTRRLQDVRAVLPLVAARPPRAWESVLGLVIYGAVIALPVAAVTPLAPAQQLLASLMSSAGIEESKPDWEAQLAVAETPEARWQVLIDAGSWAEYDEGNDAAAHAWYQQAEQIAVTFPPGDPRRLDARIGLIRTGRPEGAVDAFKALLGELRALEGEARYRLADVLEEIAWREGQSAAAERITWLREAIQVREGLSDDEQPYWVAEDHRGIALLLYEQDVAGAEAELRAGLDMDAYPMNASALAWLLINDGRPAEAEPLIRSSIAKTAGRPCHKLRQALAWARWRQSDSEGANRELEALLEDVPGKWYWRRISLMLDLIHLNEDSAERYERWRTRAREEIEGRKDGVRTMRSVLEYGDFNEPWEAPQTKARLAAFDGLGFPPPPERSKGCTEGGSEEE